MRKKKQAVERDLARVVVKTSDASQDYFLTHEQVAEFGLERIQVYNNKRTWSDPHARYKQYAIRRAS